MPTVISPLRRKVLIFGIGVSMATSSSGCGLVPSDPEVLDGADGVKVLVAGSTRDGMTAQLFGTLTVLEGGCLGVSNESTQYLVAWPAGTAVSDGAPLVVSVNSQDYKIGSDVELGGGHVPVHSLESLPHVPEECLTQDGEIFLVSN